ncbi:MAG: hypothetical protein KC503_25320 [Myxococcales bacterium]|nr:hypothetical protein [Myxococcales bacterium]
MNPVQICKKVLGDDKLSAILEQLSSSQIKQVLKEGGLKVKLSGGFVSQKKKRTVWSKKISGAIDEENEDAAAELLQQWLLNHHRGMLVDYLDALGVTHRDGETDQSFLLGSAKEKVHDAARMLLDSTERDAVDVKAYLLYIAYQQRSPVFEDFEPLAQWAAPDPNAEQQAQ